MAAESRNQGVTVHVSEDGLQASLCLRPGIDLEVLTRQFLLEVLQAREISLSERTEHEVDALIERYRLSPDEQIEAVVAEGHAPEHGIDGRLELTQTLREAIEAAALPEPTADGPGDDEQPEAVDYYNQSAFLIVDAGQSIGQVIEPTRGVDGVDVRGRILAAKDGKALDIKPDDTIRTTQEGVLEAEVGGLLSMEGARIRILQELKIPGSVDFSTGNIRFPGRVEIAKGVKDRFSVVATGTIEVRDLVEAAQIESSMDIILHKGMAGRDRGKMVAGRDVQAKYLEGVTALIGRDLVIEKDVASSTVRVGGSCRSPNAQFVGGSLLVAGACQVGVLGSDGESQMEVRLGRLPEIERLAGRGLELLDLLHKGALNARREFEQMTQAAARLSAAQAERMTELQFELETAERHAGPLEKALADLALLMRESTRTELEVIRRLHAGVEVHLGLWIARIRHDVKGPIRIDLDDEGNPRVADLNGSSSQPLAGLAEINPDEEAIELTRLLSEACDQQSDSSGRAEAA